MENKTRYPNWLFWALVALNLALAAFIFFGKKPGPPPGRGDIVGLWKKELNLTDAQAADFEKIIREHRQAIQPLERAQMENRQALLRAAESGSLDTALVAKLTAESADIHRQLDEGLVAHYRQLLAVCNPAQRERMSAIFFKTLRPPGPPPGGGPPR